MIYIALDYHIPCDNFAGEYYFAAEKTFDDDVFLLWRNEPSVIVGKYQNTLEEVNLDYTSAHGIHVARRMSGGGTVYHDLGCWEFTFITRDCGEEIEFERFMYPIVDALRSLGLDVRATGRNDIALFPQGSERGDQISGNTQYKKNGVTVHHGTLLFDTDLDEMVRATTPKEYKITSKAIKSVRERVTNIRPHLPRDMTVEAFRDYLAAHMTDRTYTVTEEDRARIREISETKFADPKWNFGANPKFEIEHELHLPGGTIELGLTVKNGVIQSAGIRGDFFAGEAAENIAQSLNGTDYTREAMAAALRDACGTLYGIGADDIVNGIFGEDRSEKNTL